MIVSASERLERDGQTMRLHDGLIIDLGRPAMIRCTRECRSRVMIWPNDAVPPTSSAIPGAAGSLAMLADQARRAPDRPAPPCPASPGCAQVQIAVIVAPTLCDTPTTDDPAARDLAGGAEVGGQRLNRFRTYRRSASRRFARPSNAGGLPCLRRQSRRPNVTPRRLRATCGSLARRPRRRAPAACARRTGTNRPRRQRTQEFAAQDEAGGQREHRQRRHRTIGQLARPRRRVRNHAGRNDAGIRRRGAETVAGGRLAVFRQIGFEQIALRLGVALERTQLHVLLVGRRGLPLELIEAGGQPFDLRRSRAWRRSPASAPDGRPRRASGVRGPRSAPAIP